MTFEVLTRSLKLRVVAAAAGLSFFVLGAACGVRPPVAASPSPVEGRFVWAMPKIAPPDSCAMTPPGPKDAPTPGEVEGAAPSNPGIVHRVPPKWPAQFGFASTETANFSGEIKPRELKAGAVVYRVIGSGGNPQGAYWANVPPPATEASWRALNAVFLSWNGASCVEKYTVPSRHSLFVWEGRAGPQPDGGRPGFYLAGGGWQYWVPAAASQFDGALIQYSPVHWLP